MDKLATAKYQKMQSNKRIKTRCRGQLKCWRAEYPP